VNVDEALELAERVSAPDSAGEALAAEVRRLREHILDIDAHATPFGDIPDDPGWVGTYLVTAGALHRALGKIGRTAPSCSAEAEVRRLRARLVPGAAVVQAWAEPLGIARARLRQVWPGLGDALDALARVHETDGGA
jgi:hypothetical protein